MLQPVRKAFQVLAAVIVAMLVAATWYGDVVQIVLYAAVLGFGTWRPCW